jgi:feruloyl esterase
LSKLPLIHDAVLRACDALDGLKDGILQDPQRTGTAEFLFSASNPDLRKFKAAGGKIILYHGWDDNQIPGAASVDYYETATRTMGGEQPTKDFFRLFMLPSSLHCYGGPGRGEADWITALENWVERGNAPDQVTVYHMLSKTFLPRPRHPLGRGEYDRTRPVFAYPDVARCSGMGDSTKNDDWVKAH